MEDKLKYKKWNISTTTGRIFPNFETTTKVTKPKFSNASKKTTCKILKVEYLSNHRILPKYKT
jgi:hypothetical protein